MLNHQQSVSKILEYAKEWLGYRQTVRLEEVVLHTKTNRFDFMLSLQEGSQNQLDCDICGEKKCSRHLNIPSWKGLFVDRGLDEAVDSVNTVKMLSVKLFFIV